MKIYVIIIGVAVALSTFLGGYLWSPPKEPAANLATAADLPSSNKEISKLIAAIESQQASQRNLSDQLSSVLQEVEDMRSHLNSEMSGVGEAVNTLGSDITVVKKTLSAYEVKLTNLENVVDGGNASSAVGLSDNNTQSQTTPKRSPQAFFEETSLKFESEVRDQAWAINTESEIMTSFKDSTKKIDLAEVTCKIDSCRVSWGYRNTEGLTPEELMFVEHELYSVLARAGLKTAVFDQSTTGNQNVAIFVKPDERNALQRSKRP